MISVSFLKFPSGTCVLCDLVSARSNCDVAGGDLETFNRTRVSTRAGELLLCG